MSEGYFTIIGGDLDRQHRYIGDDEHELHHIPQQEIPSDTNVNEDCIAPVWRQEKYTRREITVNDRVIEFFGLDSWTDDDCVSHLLFQYHVDRDAQQDTP